MKDYTTGQEHAILKLRRKHYHDCPWHYGGTPERGVKIDATWSLYDTAWSMAMDLNQPAPLREHYRSQALSYGLELHFLMRWPSAD